MLMPGACARVEVSSHLTPAPLRRDFTDVPSNFNVEGFPTIYFAKAGAKAEPMLFEGDRDVKGFLKFLRKEATVKMPKPKKKAKKATAKDEL